MKKDPEARDCKEHSEQVCSLVQMLGGIAYDGSIGSSIAYPPVKQRRVPEFKKIIPDYLNLYEKCPYQSS